MPTQKEIDAKLDEINDYISRMHQDQKTNFKRIQKEIKQISDYHPSPAKSIDSIVLDYQNNQKQLNATVLEQVNAFKSFISGVPRRGIGLRGQLCLEWLGRLTNTIEQNIEGIVEQAEKRKKDISNIKQCKTNLLNSFKQELVRLQAKFPVMPEDANNPAKMGELVKCLSDDFDSYSRSLLTSDLSYDDAVKSYAAFKTSIDGHLNQDNRFRDLKKPDSTFYPFHYALVALARAFFRVFDVIISYAMQAEHTMEKTPNRHPFFKLPEKSLSRDIAELSRLFDDTIIELDQLSESKPDAKGTWFLPPL